MTTGKEWAVVPTAEVRYVDRVGVAGPLDTSTVTALVQMTPNVDINTGQIYNMVQASVTAVRRVAPAVYLTAVANALKSVPPDPATSITGVSASAGVRWRVSRTMDLLAGIQGFWQYQQFAAQQGAQGYPTTATAEVGFLAMTLRLPAPLRF
jgi:hypothetical protein